jgi:signal transduction histidine kinase
MLETLSSIVVDELEQRLAAQRAISAQTDLVNMAVHDLKNPALNIASLSDLLLKRLRMRDGAGTGRHDQGMQ